MCIVVSDRVGAVGAFESLDAAKAALAAYAGFPFVYCAWSAPAKTGDTAWILPYLANNAVACASTDRAVVVRAQAALLRLDLVPSDDVDYWQCEVGVIVAAAQRRLDDVLAAQDAVNAKTPVLDQEKVERFLDFAARQSDDETRINILESVVPVIFGGKSEAE